MSKKNSKIPALPGGRHLTSFEIICLCVILFVGYLVLTHLPQHSDSHADIPAQDGDTPPIAVQPNIPGAAAGKTPDMDPQTGFTPTPTAAYNISAIERIVETHQHIASAQENDDGLIEVVYTDGQTNLFSDAEEMVASLSDSIHLSRLGGDRDSANGDRKSMFRAGFDELNSGEDSLNESSNDDAERNERSVQLDTFKRLAQAGDGASKEARKALDNLVPEEMPYAIEALDGMEWTAETRELTQSVMSEWGKTDPMAALAHAETYDSLRKRNEAMTTILSSFAKSDPNAALEWYFDNLETDPRTRNLSPANAFRELAAEDFGAALQRVNQIDDRRVRQSSLRSMLASVDSDQRYQVLDQMYSAAQSVEDKTMFAQEYVASKSRYQPYEAAHWINQIEHPDVQARAIESLIATWSTDRPDQAAEWAMRLADDKLRQQQLANISRNWSRYDPETAEGWLQSFPPDPDLDGAINGHISTLAKNDPAQASEWVDKIYDQNRRVNATKNIARDWLKVDPVAARDYIIQAELDDKNRAKYLSLADRAIAIQQQLDQLN